MRAVASGDEIAFHVVSFAAFAIANHRPRRFQAFKAYAARFKLDLAARIQPGFDQILDHFLLRVDGDGAAGREIRKIDAAPLASEAQVDAVVRQRLSFEALAHTGFDQQVDCALFEDARANPFFHVLPGLSFDNYRVNAFKTEQVGEHQSCRAGADYADLGAHAFSISSFAILNPVLPTGTPA